MTVAPPRCAASSVTVAPPHEIHDPRFVPYATPLTGSRQQAAGSDDNEPLITLDGRTGRGRAGDTVIADAQATPGPENPTGHTPLSGGHPRRPHAEPADGSRITPPWTNRPRHPRRHR
ncbi:cupin domain-containing protein [Streptomyces sp. NPDC014983]|uniref:cupin domain-containing protein n=1 Tax=Streptomyces sp. NPDC014983 TaxID=3364933 RepID=UPI0036FF9D86